MKYLKKVSASQLISNEGTIIDSMSSGDDPTVNAPSIHAVKDYVETTSKRAYGAIRTQLSANVTNTTTSNVEFGPTLNITTTGRPLIIEATTVGFVNAGNIDVWVRIDGSSYDVLGTTSASSRERITGYVIANNLPAGNHTIKLAFSCSQSGRTATMTAYSSISILAYEI